MTFHYTNLHLTFNHAYHSIISTAQLIKIKSISRKKNIPVSINGTSNILIKLSQCCHPIPGDDIIGFITRGRGLSVHKKNCRSLNRLNVEKERFINIVWESSHTTYPNKITIHAIDRPNLLKDIVEVISASKTNTIKMDAQLKEKDEAVFTLVLEVRSVNHLDQVISKLKKIKDVITIYK